MSAQQNQFTFQMVLRVPTLKGWAPRGMQFQKRQISSGAELVMRTHFEKPPRPITVPIAGSCPSGLPDRCLTD
jgi:hypothetical protein